MKTLLLSLVLITAAGIVATAQTKKIAHRSHSGSGGSFDLNGSDNFGIVYYNKKSSDTVNKAADSSRKPEPPATNTNTRKKTVRKAK